MDPTASDGVRPSPLVVASVGRDESVCEVLVEAFLSVHVDVFERETTLQDRIDCDALDGIDRETTGTVGLTFSVWDHRVVVTPDLVEIYEGNTTGWTGGGDE